MLTARDERSGELAAGSAQFEAWRRARIPGRLWELAESLAKRHGVSATAQALKVGYYSLQDRLALQFTPHMRLLVCVEPIDFRKGIDGLVALCREQLREDPFRGSVFVFRNRRAVSVKVLAYDGQGF